MTQDNHIWVLLSRRLSGEATAAEIEELQQLLEHSPQKQYIYSILHSWFTDLPSALSGQPAEDPDFESRFQKILNHPEAKTTTPPETLRHPDLPHHHPESHRDPESPRDPDRPHHPQTFPLKKRLIYISSIAASVAALLFLSWSVLRQRSASGLPKTTTQVHTEEVLAKPGARTHLLLPDGTQVWLNSNSKLKYSNDFNTQAREVSLEGEAYFDVVKDAHRPFIVHTSSIDVKVLGTSFTIKSYPQDETIEATLLKGTIEVSRKDNPNTARVLLKPNEKLVFNKITVSTGRSGMTPGRINIHPGTLPDIAINSVRNDIPDSDKVETAWMYNRLVFKGDNFKELAEKMERWYNVKITIRDSSLINCRFGGAFAGETVEEAFKELQLTTAFNYKINGNEIELYAKR